MPIFFDDTAYYPDNYDNTKTTIVIRANVTEIPADTFKDFSSLTTIEFESNINLQTIGDSAFSNCAQLSNITLPSSVTSIGQSAFINCGSLSTIIIPQSVTYLGDSIFQNCSSLVNVTMDCPNITKIPDYTFYNCSGLRSISFLSPYITTIGKYAFYNTGLNEIIIPQGIQLLDDYCFNGNFPTVIIIPNSVTYIGDYVFILKNQILLTIPSSVTHLGILADNDGLSSASIYNFSKIKILPILGITIMMLCFLVNTKILTLQSNGKEKYMQIQHLHKGVLVKTSENGYKKIDVIGHFTIDHQMDNPDKKNKLYVCSQNTYPELFEDLVITGCHSILVNKLTDKQRAETVEMTGRVFITENHYRLFACLDEKTKVYPKNGEYEIWHFALENEDEKGNYGVYANGLLVESSSKRMMKEYSGMQLL